MKPITIQPHPATDPPDVDTTVLVSDGYEVCCGWYDDSEPGGQWYDCVANPIANVIWWADLPAPNAHLGS